MRDKFTWSDVVNKELREQIGLAISLKIKIPEFVKVDSSEELDKLRLNPDVLIRGHFGFQKTLGCRVGFAAFFNGDKFVNYTGMIKESFMFAGNQGLELNHNILMSYGIDQSKSSKRFKDLSKMIKEKDPEFLGFVQFNVFVDTDGDWWYDSIVFGAQPELVFNYTNLIGEDEESRFGEPVFFKNRYAASLRIMPIGWPNVKLHLMEDDSETFKGFWDLYLDKQEGCFIAQSFGSNIKDTWKELYHKCSGVERFGYLYRVDGSDVCKSRFHMVKEYDLV